MRDSASAGPENIEAQRGRQKHFLKDMFPSPSTPQPLHLYKTVQGRNLSRKFCRQPDFFQTPLHYIT